MKPDESDLSKSMLKQYGPLLTGEDLWKSLGYKSWASFSRAVRSGTVGVRVFNVEGRKGRFALTTDVASWLAKIGDKPANELDLSN